MKKILLSLATLASLTFAADHNLYPNSYYLFVNYNSNPSESNLDDSYSFDIRFNQNNMQFSNFSIDTLQYVMEYSNLTYLNSGNTTSSFKGGANVLWYLDNPSPFTLYLLAGVGMKYVNNPEDPQSLIGIYTNAAVGLEYNVRNDIAIVGEKKFTYESSEKKSYSTSLGLRYSF
jgi:hypothetical protein